MLLSLALIIALGALGIGYAAWTDTIHINGSVTTGTLDIDVGNDYSGTLIYKDTALGSGVGPNIEKIVIRWQQVDGVYTYYYNNGGSWTVLNLGSAFDPFAEPPVVPADWVYVSGAWANSGGDGDTDTVSVVFDKIYPCTDYIADFKVFSSGNVPVKIKLDNLVFSTANAPDGNPWSNYVKLYAGPNINSMVPVNPSTGYQIETSAWAAIVAHIPQDNRLMNQTLTFTGDIVAAQWDRYNETPSQWDMTHANPY